MQMSSPVQIEIAEGAGGADLTAEKQRNGVPQRKGNASRLVFLCAARHLRFSAVKSASLRVQY